MNLLSFKLGFGGLKGSLELAQGGPTKIVDK